MEAQWVHPCVRRDHPAPPLRSPDLHCRRVCSLEEATHSANSAAAHQIWLPARQICSPHAVGGREGIRRAGLAGTNTAALLEPLCRASPEGKERVCARAAGTSATTFLEPMRRATRERGERERWGGHLGPPRRAPSEGETWDDVGSSEGDGGDTCR